jgi:hypothetical protein
VDPARKVASSTRIAAWASVRARARGVEQERALDRDEVVAQRWQRLGAAAPYAVGHELVDRSDAGAEDVRGRVRRRVGAGGAVDLRELLGEARMHAGAALERARAGGEGVCLVPTRSPLRLRTSFCCVARRRSGMFGVT